MALLSFIDSPHGGALKLLPEWNTQALITPTTIIDHTQVGSSLGTYYYFRDHTGIESHFSILGRRSGTRDGEIWQFMDTGRRADANLNANRFAISIETEDNGFEPIEPWSAKQLDSLKWLHHKLRAVHPTISRLRCTSCFGGGLGYHSMCGTTSTNPWTPSAGKLLALDTLIPTPHSLKTLAEIHVGDQVIDEIGYPCTVTAVYDAIPEQSYRITFDSGLEIVAGGEHQWVTITRGQRKGYFRRDRSRDVRRGPRPVTYPDNWATWGSVRDTNKIAATLRTGSTFQHTIPVTRPVQLPDAQLPIDPYLLGVFLGDGCTRNSVISTSIRPDSAEFTDAEFIANQFIAAGYTLGAWQRSSGHGVTFRALGLEPQLRALGVLGKKHVPDTYLFASPAQRLALLQGLMDTDGSISSRGYADFTSTTEALADAVTWLASSLGQRVRRSKGRATLNRIDHGPTYRVGFRPTTPVFRLPRKCNRIRVASVRSQSCTIIACEPVPVQPMRCLTVDSPNSMYLVTERCLPTHNTCPAAARIKQFNDVLVPAFLDVPPDWFATATSEQLEAIVRKYAG